FFTFLPLFSFALVFLNFCPSSFLYGFIFDEFIRLDFVYFCHVHYRQWLVHMYVIFVMIVHIILMILSVHLFYPVPPTHCSANVTKLNLLHMPSYFLYAIKIYGL